MPDLKRNGIEIKNIEDLDYTLDVKNNASKREIYLWSRTYSNDHLQRYEGKTRELLNFLFPEDSDDNYTKATFTV